ncbi:hypothetical protein F9K33_09560 [bacterium]|nr:MAG: hypothetical protein F9K33_09560 [bacterium]
MTPEEHQSMKNYLLSSDSETVWNGTVRNFTFANVSAMFIWFGTVLLGSNMDIFVWLKILALCLSITFSGWFADRAWYFFVSEKFNKPFSLKAYVSRAPFFFFLSGILFTMALLLVRWIDWTQTLQYFLIGGCVQLAIQIPLQWFLFNRLRKLSLTNL